MKIKSIISTTAIALTAMTANAQSKVPTLQELIPGGKNYLYPSSLLNVAWLEDGGITYSTTDSVFTLSKSWKQTSALSLKEYDEKHAGKPNNASLSEDEVSADGQWKTLIKDNRLFIVNTDSAIEVEISDGKVGNDVIWGQAVHRNEFGIMKGTFWSPSGHLLAFYRMDQSMVGDYPLVNTDAREAELNMIKYPMAGMTSHQVTLGIYNPDTKQTVYMQTQRKELNPDDHYLTCITWRPNGKQIYIAEINREQNHVDVNAYDAATGEFVETLFTEQSEKYVEPEHPLFFLPGSNDKFVWQSERDGYNHLYLYDLSKKLKGMVPAKTTTDFYTITSSYPCTALTFGDWAVTSIIGADAKGKNLYFMGTAASPLENQCYVVNVEGSHMKIMRRLTQEPGLHHVIMNADYTAFYDTYTSHSTPRACQLVNVKSGKRMQLHKAANPFADYKMPEITIGTIKAADGKTDLYYRLVKPVDFDANKKYPTVVYLYNGPHAQLITEGVNYAARGWDIYMAQRGYVIFTIDGRGSDNRGLAFEQAIWHHLGETEAADQMCGIAYLKSLSWVDAERIGIHGWSYGGFMTTYMMLNHPETFKVGVAGGPVLDWSRYEVMYGERYMGTPENNPEGYAANRLIEQAGKLQGHLLLIHDDQDGTVVPQHSMQFLKNAVKEGTYPDYFMYPGHEHNVRGIDRIHLHEKITRYFDDYLK